MKTNIKDMYKIVYNEKKTKPKYVLNFEMDSNDGDYLRDYIIFSEKEWSNLPEFFFLMRIYGEVICLCAVALEEACQSLSRVHDFKIPGIMNKLLVFIRIRRCGHNIFVFNTFELLQERLIGFRSEITENRRLVENGATEICRVDIAVTDALIVCQHNFR